VVDVERVGTGDNAAMAEADDQSDDNANINGDLSDEGRGRVSVLVVAVLSGRS
jgi:hypothetical protein